MEIPEGVQATRRTMCKLPNALYRLKAVVCLWDDHIDALLSTLSSRHSSADLNLYMTSGVCILLYHDNLLLAGSNRTNTKDSKKALSTKHWMTDLGPVKQYLSIQISRFLDCSIRLTQEWFIGTILQLFNMVNCNGVCIPMDAGVEL